MPYSSKALVAAAIVCLSASHAAAQTAVADTRLNVRSGPGPAFGIVTVMPPGSKLSIVKCTDEWCRIRVGWREGYVSRALLKLGTDSFASAAPPAAAAEPATPHVAPSPTGPHVWQWRDSAWRDTHWRDLEWHNRLNR